MYYYVLLYTTIYYYILLYIYYWDTPEGVWARILRRIATTTTYDANQRCGTCRTPRGCQPPQQTSALTQRDATCNPSLTQMDGDFTERQVVTCSEWM